MNYSYIHVYNATIQAIMSTEWLLIVEKNASLQVWETFYQDVYDMYCCFVTCVGVGEWVMSQKKMFRFEKNVGNYGRPLTCFYMKHFMLV